MEPNDNREEILFREARQRPIGPEREAYLDQACAGNEALRRRLAALLRAHENPDSFLEPPVGGLLGQMATRPEPDFKVEEAGARIGRYKLLEKIGEGGCGVVYMAEQEEPIRRRVGFKLIKLGMDTKQVIARFESERQALALMDHPNIAKVLDAGATDTGRPYFVMELVRGIKITDYCDQNNLSTEERLKLFVQVCHAIQHAHQKGIIHRDIKPSNILVTLHDGVPVPKVIDFGIAKATGQRLTDKTLFTAFHQFIGTPVYMSPEQAELSGLDIDTRSDIYALGALLYELLTGKTPFDVQRLVAAGLDEIRRIIREEDPPRPSTRISTLDAAEQTAIAKRRHSELPKLLGLIRGDLDWIVMRTLEKDRTRRYETANGLADDVLRHVNNEPVVARPPGKLYRFQKLVKRNKLAFAAGATVLAVLVVVAVVSSSQAVLAAVLLAGTGISTWQAVVATRAKANALEAKTESVAAQKNAERAQGAEKSMRIEAEHQLYAAKMNLAQQAWDQNNLGQLRQLLEDTQDSPCRGFEWYYWQPLTHLALRTLRGHLKGVISAAYSPDGRQIVTASMDRTARVWDASEGKELLTLRGHRDFVWSVAFAPDGRRIVTASFDHTAKVWEAASGRELLTFKGHKDRIRCVAFSPDSRTIVTSSLDQTAKVWEAGTGKEILTLEGHTSSILGVAFSPDGQRIVTASFDHTAKVWEAASGRELLTLNGHSAPISSAVFSPDGRRIATGGGDQTVKVWEAASGHELHTLKGHTSWVRSVAFSPDSQRIVTGGSDRTAKVWDTATGRELFTLKDHGDWIYSVAFSPDGRQIATGSRDGEVKLWDAGGAKEPLILQGHSDDIWSVAISADGRRIVTGSHDGTAKLWEAASGRELLTLRGHGAQIDSPEATFSNVKGRGARVFSVAISPNGQHIVTGGTDNIAKVWETASGKDLFTIKGHNDWITSVAFSPDGQRIVTASADHTAKVWDAASGREMLTLKGHGSALSSAVFSPDGQRIASGSYDHTAKIWEAASGRQLLTLKGDDDDIGSLSFSPDGQRIVGSAYNTFTVWDAASGRELLTIKGHDMICSVALSPDGQRIVAASADTAKVWDASSGRELLTLKGHKDWVMSVGFSSDGRRIVTGSKDRTARVWETARPEQIAAWQAEERAATQRLAAARAEQEREIASRARDSIKRWLILGPIKLTVGQTGAQGLHTEQIEDEARLKPKAGESRFIGVSEFKWRELALTNEVIDFNALLGHETTQCVAYAVCYLRSEAEQSGLQMLVGSRDEAKVYLNGKQVYTNAFPRPFYAEVDHVTDVALNAGLNVLVFKVVNETREWKGSIRFTDAAGQPLKGVRVALDPDAKESANSSIVGGC
jgi:eukaryotic-like serine/threonine-protein kinase